MTRTTMAVVKKNPGVRNKRTHRSDKNSLKHVCESKNNKNKITAIKLLFLNHLSYTKNL